MRSMRARCVLVLMALLLFGQAAPVAARQAPRGRRVLIGFRSDTGPQTPEARASAVRQGGGTVHRSPRLVPVVAATLSEEAIKTFRARRDVAYVEDDVILRALGQTTPWGVDRIDADLAWPTGNTGRGVKVAILDTGVDATHPDLLPAGGINYSGSTKDGSTSPADWNDNHGHGTHVAGIVGARNNDIGVIGVAPDVSLWAVKVIGDDGTGYTSDIIQGLDWCAANGVRVASMSFGGGGTTSLQAACDRAYAGGVVLVAASGNDGGAVLYPAAYSSVIAVSAVDAQNLRASFSNFGPQIRLAAPGVSIYSTYKGGSYATMSGTSMACPHVSGAAALAWASGLTSAAAVRDRLTTTAEDLGPIGFDTSYGYGLVDAQRAAAGGTVPVDSPPTVAITVPLQGSTVSKAIVVQATATDDKGVAQVEFRADGVSLGVDTQGSDGWSASWDTTRSADGQHTITAMAKDTAGQTASNSVTVTVQNTTPPPTGTISVSSITYSVSGGRLGGSNLNVTVNVVDSFGKPVANAYVWANLYLNGQVFMTPAGATNTSGSFLVKVNHAPAGSYKTVVTRVSATGRTWDGVTPTNGFTKPR